MKKENILAIVFALGVGFAARAATEVTFPNKDGSGDISSAAAWDREVTSDLLPVFGSASVGQTYTALADVSFAGMKFQTGSTTSPVVLDMRDSVTGADPGPRAITVSGDFAGAAGKSALTLRGGRWNITGALWPSGYGNQMMLGLDGVRMKTATLAANYGCSAGNLVDIYGGSCVTTVTLRVQYDHGSNGRIVVRDGSELVATGTGNDSFKTDFSSGGANGFVVTGEGSSLRRLGTANTAIGVGSGVKSYLLVDDHATAYFESMPRVGTDTAASNAYITVQNGGTLDIRNSLDLGNRGRGARLNVLSGGVVAIQNTLIVGGYDYETVDCHVGITNGTVTAAALTVGNRGRDCTFRVSGAQGSFGATSASANSLVGNDNSVNCRNAAFIVEDGATATVKGRLHLGCSRAASNALVRVTGTGSTLRTSATVAVGFYGSGATRARFEVLDGGIAETGDLYLGGPDYVTTDNSALVSNATLKTSWITLGNKITADRQTFRLMGPKAALTVTGAAKKDLSILYKGADCRFILDDGAHWTNNAAATCSVALNSTSDGGPRGRFELLNGSEFYTTNMFSIVGINYACPSNTVFVGSGSRLYAGREIATFSYANALVLSNGVAETRGDVTVTGNSSSGYIGMNSNNWVRFEGASPQLIATNGTVDILRSSHLVFDYPPEGYAAGLVPVRAKSLVLDATSELVVSGFAEAGRRFAGRRFVKLAETTNGVTIPASVLAAAKATLPPKCDLFVQDNCLWLKLNGTPQGTLFFLR